MDTVGTPAILDHGERKEYPYLSIERTAWLVLLLAFFVCILVAIGVPLGVRYYIQNAETQMPAHVQAASITQQGGSTIRARLCGVSQPLAVTTEGISLPQCSTIETDPSSKAFISLFEGSTVTLSTDTSLFLKEMSAPRFGWSTNPNVIVIEQRRGSARYGAAPPLTRENVPPRPLEFVIVTPHLTARLAPGSYSIEVDETSSQIAVREGVAVVSNATPQHSVSVGQGQSLTARPGEPLPESSGATRNLIRGGDFTGPALDPAWTIVKDQGGDGGAIDGTVELTTIANRRSVRIRRSGSENNSAETGIRQVIDKDVSDFRTLSFKADVRLHFQDLPGGGYLSTEYPLIILLRYRDATGSENEWVHGFYYQNEANNPTARGEQIPVDVWVPYESGNLLKGLSPRPFRILSIKIYASGWDYESYVSGVQLLAE